MTDKVDLTQLEYHYGRLTLHKADLPEDPIDLVNTWLALAIDTGDDPEPNAMSLATADKNGRPSNRMVLLKEIIDAKFIFYTSFNSLKAQQLSANPYAALCLYWGKLERQIRIEGTVGKCKKAQSEAYFYSRSKENQLATLASDQSQPINNRDTLIEHYETLVGEYKDCAPPYPVCWGGYELLPSTIEFWQGREHRLHDRLRYEKNKMDNWLIQRLCP